MSLALSFPGHHETRPAGCATGAFSSVTLAEQDAFVPPYWPLQVQVQEPGLVIAEAVPAEQRLRLVLRRTTGRWPIRTRRLRLWLC